MGEQDRTIIRALRCSASVPPADAVCKRCAYGIVEEWKLGSEEQRRYEVVSCDTDRIVVDAADRLEELTGGKPKQKAAQRAGTPKGGNQVKPYTL